NWIPKAHVVALRGLRRQSGFPNCPTDAWLRQPTACASPNRLSRRTVVACGASRRRVVEDQEDLRGVLRDLLTVTRLPKLRTAKPVCPKLAPSTPTSSSW